MPNQLPEPYRYVTDTVSLQVHRVKDGVQELEENEWETICQWKFRTGVRPWVWGRHWFGIRSCVICQDALRGESRDEEQPSSDSEDQESAISQ